MAKKKAEEDEPFDIDHDDFDVVRCIVNLVRRYPKSKAEFIKDELLKLFPGLGNGQIAKCCGMITERWSDDERAHFITKVQGKKKRAA
ncbi:hypothetical protein LU11_gp348 [Pseudomonas phage Lu11]|uniref:hypothetical protein n=1 Tax=Pseudomonas phage Lu11 TaxID=1161927 RepID=UPI00025F1886|nr:hypothetical protein LU11_gp348 [Pseudomonas phage Lu11]AFH14879.1 hypothetical protein Lu11_0341 [Pseudomonas phage Lu11]